MKRSFMHQKSSPYSAVCFDQGPPLVIKHLHNTSKFELSFARGPIWGRVGQPAVSVLDVVDLAGSYCCSFHISPKSQISVWCWLDNRARSILRWLSRNHRPWSITNWSCRDWVRVVCRSWMWHGSVVGSFHWPVTLLMNRLQTRKRRISWRFLGDDRGWSILPIWRQF